MGGAEVRARRLTEPAAVRLLLMGLGVGFLALFLVLPLVVVFVEAFRNGIAPYLASIREPDAVAALTLTLTAAAFAVPANLVFGVAAGWAVAKFRFPNPPRPPLHKTNCWPCWVRSATSSPFSES